MSLDLALDVDDLTRLPSRRDEDWRWTDLRGLVREPLPASAATMTVQRGGPLADLALPEVVIANGRLNWWPEYTMPEGLKLYEHRAADAPLMAGAMPMALMAARAAQPTAWIVEVTGEEPRDFRLRFVSRSDATAHHARIGVMVRAGARATLVETHEGEGAGYLANTLVEIFLEAGARLERIVLMDEAADAISIASAETHLGADSRFSQIVVTSGARRERVETRVDHPGTGAQARLDGVYVVGGRRHADITTVVTHSGVDGVTDQLTKGVVDGQGRAVFQGRIVVSPGADRTDARMGHHALILSDQAEVDAKPELEIYADDVACAHGNSVGSLDEEALFYAAQRGIPEPQARAMLTTAFLGQVADRIEHEGAREIVRAWIAQRLEATS
jgi:Fe-S cluster assembly protein SufD